MKPVLVYFHKPRALAAGGGARKDPEVEGCEAWNGDLWKRRIITGLAGEFVCVRVDKRAADRNLLGRHGVARAPAVEILDFRGRRLFFQSARNLKHAVLAKGMEQARIRVEREVKRLAAGKEGCPLVQRAKSRARVIEQRESYGKGLASLLKRRWAEAERLFREALAVEEASDWRKKAETGLIEIQAGKAFTEAKKLFKRRRYKQAIQILERIGREYKEAHYFSGLAKELLGKIEKKMK